MVKKTIILPAFIIALAAILFFFGRNKGNVPTIIDMSQEADIADIDKLSSENKASEESSSGETSMEETKPAEEVKNIAVPRKITDALSSKKSPTASEETGKEDTKKKKDGIQIINKPIPAGFRKSSGRAIDTIVIHSSYNALGGDPYSVAWIMQEYIQYGVSAHYLIDREGTVYRMVEDNDIAWHAGVSRMPDGRTDVNEFSLGIEIVNTKEGIPTDEEYKSLNALIAELKNEYPIRYVVGHKDIAPGRKDDPWNFDWTKIAQGAP